MTVSEPLVLGFETSCDETGVGLVRGHTLLADALATSMAEHERFGGVVPEIASRAHLEAMVPTVHRALADAGVSAEDVDAVAVTSGPGLTGALLVGVAAAKAYALALDKPLYGVNHLAAHVAVDELQHGRLAEPSIALLVSGGHSSLLLVPDLARDVESLGRTVDDAAGEAFDKGARVLRLPFPGRPPIDKGGRLPGPAFPRRPADRQGGPRRRPRRDRLPSRAHRPAGRALRLLVLRPEDRRRAVGGGAAAGRRAGAGRRRRRVVPGGGSRRPDREGGAGLQGPRRRPPGAGRRGGGQLAAAGAGRGGLRGRRGRAAGAQPAAVYRQRGDGGGPGLAAGGRRRRPVGPGPRRRQLTPHRDGESLTDDWGGPVQRLAPSVRGVRRTGSFFSR